MTRILFSTKWVKLMESSSGFHYLERKGKDSIAVLLLKIENDELKCLIRKQPLCALRTSDNQHLDEILGSCPITGSMELNEDPIECTVREIEEESGFTIKPELLNTLGTYIVGTQTNEICSMFVADVTGLNNTEAKGDGSACENASHNEWISFNKIQNEVYSALPIMYLRIINLIKSSDSKLNYISKYIKR